MSIKSIKKITTNKSLILLIAGGLIVLLFGFAWSYHRDVIREKDNIIQNEIKLRNTLTSEIKTYQNKENEWVVEKKTLQASLDKMNGLFDDLSDSQKELVRRLNNIEKGQTTIAAALIDVEASINDLTHTGSVDVDDDENTILFKHGGENLKYSFLIGEVKKAFPLVEPTLKIQSLSIPTKQMVEFYWENNRKEGYPVSFKITNTNPYISILNTDSYIIPMNKTDIDPTRWEKLMNWGNKNKKSLIGVGAATLIGVGIGVLVL